MLASFSAIRIRQSGAAMFARLLIAFFLIVSAAVSANADPAKWRSEWPRTDFSIHSVDLSEIMSGGPPKDGIPALIDPEFIAAETETRLSPREPVMTLELEDSTPRAYPVRYLLWHEIVNDTVAGVPVAVTYCPLCNSGVFFDRSIGGETLTFGVSGKLRKSDMVMYDRESESWWQQAVGEAIVGSRTGEKLTTLPGWLESWSEFVQRNPDGLVMDEPRYARRYGDNPYVGYDTSSFPFLYSGELPPFDISPLARVVRVGNRAWLLEQLKEAQEHTEYGVNFTWTEGQASALDTRLVGDGRDVGTVRVRDAGTGEDLAHDVMFAFAFHAFYPDGEWVLEQ